MKQNVMYGTSPLVEAARASSGGNATAPVADAEKTLAGNIIASVQGKAAGQYGAEMTQS